MHCTLLQLRQEDNEERKRKTQQGDTDLTWKTSPTKRGKNHGRQPAKLHYNRECLHNAGDFTDVTPPNRRLTRGLYIGGNLGFRRSVRCNSSQLGPSLRRRASLHSSEVGLYFVEFGSTYNKLHLETNSSL